MPSNVMSYNLSGMGCSAGVIAVDLAKDVLRVHRNSLALVVTTEVLHMNWYTGKDRSMLLAKCLFRMGGTAILMSSRDHDKKLGKYELLNVVRTTKAQNDKAYGCVFQDTDIENKQGVKFPFLGSACLYVPDFRTAFEHFCTHTGGKSVIKAMKTNLKLKDWDVEASKMVLFKFGNTSSSSIWYELSYIEAKGRMNKGDGIWQIAFGRGFNCNSAMRKSLTNTSNIDDDSPWFKWIESYPIDISD